MLSWDEESDATPAPSRVSEGLLANARAKPANGLPGRAQLYLLSTPAAQSSLLRNSSFIAIC